MTLTDLLAGIGERNLIAFFAVLARVSPLFIVAPLFSSNSIPPRVRGIIAVALAVGITPLVADRIVDDLDAWSIAALIGGELLVGAAFAYVLAAFFAAIQTAGAFLDTAIGFAYGSLIDPMTGTQSSVLTQVYTLFAIGIFIAIGGDSWVIEGLVRTYEVAGPGTIPGLVTMTSGVTTAFVGIFAAAIQVSGPVILAVTLADAAFGLVSRVVPQMNVFAVGFPAKIILGFALIPVTLPFVADWMGVQLQQDVANALRVISGVI